MYLLLHQYLYTGFRNNILRSVTDENTIELQLNRILHLLFFFLWLCATIVDVIASCCQTLGSFIDSIVTFNSSCFSFFFLLRFVLFFVHFHSTENGFHTDVIQNDLIFVCSYVVKKKQKTTQREFIESHSDDVFRNVRKLAGEVNKMQTHAKKCQNVYGAICDVLKWFQCYWQLVFSIYILNHLSVYCVFDGL